MNFIKFLHNSLNLLTSP